MPFTCSKTACTPQKQPPANTAVCLADVVAKGASRAGFGISAFGAAGGRAPRERIPAQPRSSTMATIENVRPMCDAGMLLPRKDIYGFCANLDPLDATK